MVHRPAKLCLCHVCQEDQEEKCVACHIARLQESHLLLILPQYPSCVSFCRGQSMVLHGGSSSLGGQHSLATGPVMADPFISPLLFTITPALSSKQRKTFRRKDGQFIYFEDNAGVIVNNKG